uniref:Uncharacterized protein n=1 Tax=Rangifer tarandus platyrhynchus TaxID=3082113 RepID=A0ACB0EXZ2_RANTA|nr:unnamed protein product [Rangifer tarandus platyrhynchus]
MTRSALAHPSNRQQRADRCDCSRDARPAAPLSSRDHNSEAASAAFARLIRASWVCLPALCPDIAPPPPPTLGRGILKPALEHWEPLFPHPPNGADDDSTTARDHSEVSVCLAYSNVSQGPARQEFTRGAQRVVAESGWGHVTPCKADQINQAPGGTLFLLQEGDPGGSLPRMPRGGSCPSRPPTEPQQRQKPGAHRPHAPGPSRRKTPLPRASAPLPSLAPGGAATPRPSPWSPLAAEWGLRKGRSVPRGAEAAFAPAPAPCGSGVSESGPWGAQDGGGGRGGGGGPSPAAGWRAALSQCLLPGFAADTPFPSGPSRPESLPCELLFSIRRCPGSAWPRPRTACDFALLGLACLACQGSSGSGSWMVSKEQERSPEPLSQGSSVEARPGINGAFVQPGAEEHVA